MEASSVHFIEPKTLESSLSEICPFPSYIPFISLVALPSKHICNFTSAATTLVWITSISYLKFYMNLFIRISVATSSLFWAHDQQNDLIKTRSHHDTLLLKAGFTFHLWSKTQRPDDGLQNPTWSGPLFPLCPHHFTEATLNLLLFFYILSITSFRRLYSYSLCLECSFFRYLYGQNPPFFSVCVSYLLLYNK